MRLKLLALLLLATLPAQAADSELLANLDALYAKRGDAATVKELEDALKKAMEAAPNDYALVWRTARIRQWEADGAMDSKLKRVLGRQTWDLGERALKLAPDRVEGHYYAAAGIGAYSQAVGVMKALGEGLEGKFNERLDAALRIDPTFARGSPWLAKGRYHYELPWPKRDLGKSAAFYEKAIAKFPEMLRANYYLAETLLKDGKAKQAREAIQKVKQGSTAFDPPEGQRIQEWAKKVEADIEEELK
ncbi:tetratricopeptide repeat protein [Corallococcus sp. M34]|uniref:tetratricopeptide repeat protein n=1 Tax=Citreicoccus inhibens TaxID=2849499 RepID=UPI001C220636|nr:tetratricopeptide repeat protein [Citreicoccus inhibens]MBU8896875.1 tetratricopeptide repeat protein [Citreicoccus inhibens]